MNNKGFGIEMIFIFIILVFFSMISFYSFMKNIIHPLMYTEKRVFNYKNEYKIYMREHQLGLNKKLS